MAKQGKKRPEKGREKKPDALPPIPELQESTNLGKQKSGPILPWPTLLNFGTMPYSPVYPVISTDLVMHETENGLTEAELQDL